jgi:hypothetical protein
MFSRKRGSADQGGNDDTGRGGRHARNRTNPGLARDPFFDDETDESLPEFGPYDAGDAPSDDLTRLDLGALRIPTVAGVDIQLETAPGGEIQRVQLAHGGSRLQLGAFAAPRSEGVWDEVRAELREALTTSGAKFAEVEGEYGPELQARFGNTQGMIEVRHIGIDGPRWFLHGVYVGAAAVDPDQAGPLRDALRGLVVDRGVEARPVKEPLPLRLPAEAAAQLAELVANDPANGDRAAGGSSNQRPGSNDRGSNDRGNDDRGNNGRGTSGGSGTGPALGSGAGGPRGDAPARGAARRGGAARHIPDEAT